MATDQDFHKITALLDRIYSKLDMQIKAAERHAIGVHRLEHRLAALEAEVKNTNGKGRI